MRYHWTGIIRTEVLCALFLWLERLVSLLTYGCVHCDGSGEKKMFKTLYVKKLVEAKFCVHNLVSFLIATNVCIHVPSLCT